MARSITVKFPLHGFGWMMLGAALMQTGRSADALTSMKKAAALSPGDAGVHSNLGNILQSLGQLDEAEASYRRALQIKPEFAEALCNLSNTLRDLGRSGEAEVFIRRALQIKPEFVEALCNLANILCDLARFEEAEVSLRRALQIRPGRAETHNNLGVIFQSMGRLHDAEASYRRAITLNPDYADAYGNLGGLLKGQGKLDEALACLQQQVRLSPENGEAQHMIASLTGENTERAPSQYVVKVFDGYAEKFDKHLQQVLKYEAPVRLVEIIARHAAPPAEKWNVLDLGCGTGLVGLAISPYARQLVGVDLSARMLGKARERNLYHRLERLDLLAMMRGEKTSSYDVIIAADVFIYLGKIDEIVSEAKRLLCPGGLLSFSVEAFEEPANAEAGQGEQRDFKLENTGRYSQSPGYLNRLASANSFQTLEMAPAQIRMEHGRPINGYLVLWKKSN